MEKFNSPAPSGQRWEWNTQVSRAHNIITMRVVTPRDTWLDSRDALER